MLRKRSAAHVRRAAGGGQAAHRRVQARREEQTLRIHAGPERPDLRGGPGASVGCCDARLRCCQLDSRVFPGVLLAAELAN